MSSPVVATRAEASSLPPPSFFDAARGALQQSARLITWYGRPGSADGDVVLTLVVEREGRLQALRTTLPRERGFHSLTRDFPPAHIFEREIFEEHGLKPHDHPWLKQVRFSGAGQGKMAQYPFYRLEGKEVHEVGVGPIHAGVIEPGHFRFMCLGETVHHLEIQLGYQHRGVEALLRGRPPRAMFPVVETVAGDTTIGHMWAHCDAIEALAGVEVPLEVELSRGIGLELERIAMHLAGLAGMCTDVGFLPGSSTYGRLRTTAINTSMLLCGSRFGRGWLRAGGARAQASEEDLATVRANLKLLKDDIGTMNRLFLEARTVRHRLAGTGTVTRAQALEIGLVGMAARMAGVAIDVRKTFPGRLYEALPVNVVTEDGGDCWARALVRLREIDESLRWIELALARPGVLAPRMLDLPQLAPGSVAVAVREGWRGEVVHCIETDERGQIAHYKVQDPSLRNWFGLALALRGNEISDFPICNKSFDLSYCGNDL